MAGGSFRTPRMSPAADGSSTGRGGTTTLMGISSFLCRRGVGEKGAKKMRIAWLIY
jgi:hypothetical protein